MSRFQRFQLRVAQWFAQRNGFDVVRATPLALLPSRVEAISQRLRTSGHLAHRYHVRQTLEHDVAAVSEQVARLHV